MADFNIIFQGKVLPGFEHNKVVHALANVLKISSAEKQQQLLSGKKFILKKSVSADVAETIINKLAKLGAECEMEAREPIATVRTEPLLSFDQDDSDGDTAVAEITQTVNATKTQQHTASTLSLTPIDSPAEVPTGKAQFSARDIAPVYETASVESYAPSSINPAQQGEAELIINQNTSGQGAMASVPAEIEGWCWGAFSMGWIWAFGNRTWIGLLTLIPIVNLPVMIMMGLKGREWAWRNKRWSDIEHFQDVQRKWRIAGGIFFLLSLYLGFSTMSDIIDITPEQMQEFEQTNQALRETLDTIEDPEQRKQMH
ncbi:MAG: hypothetical protein HRU20_19295 [Pseudomonadales bacterium]|nr:hypothetical protein [Pseudomonadales bacterium]